jgi:hypothetical protein
MRGVRAGARRFTGDDGCLEGAPSSGGKSIGPFRRNLANHRHLTPEHVGRQPSIIKVKMLTYCGFSAPRKHFDRTLLNASHSAGESNRPCDVLPYLVGRTVHSMLECSFDANKRECTFIESALSEL